MYRQYKMFLLTEGLPLRRSRGCNLGPQEFFYIRALKSHALSASLTHFDAISRSHADTSISHALALFW